MATTANGIKSNEVKRMEMTFSFVVCCKTLRLPTKLGYNVGQQYTAIWLLPAKLGYDVRQ